MTHVVYYDSKGGHRIIDLGLSVPTGRTAPVARQVQHGGGLGFRVYGLGFREWELQSQPNYTDSGDFSETRQSFAPDVVYLGIPGSC